MMRLDYDSMVRATYHGPFEQSPWSSLLSMLRQGFSSSIVSIVLARGNRADGAGDLWVHDCVTDADRIARHFYDEFHPFDPVDFEGMVPGRAYAERELMDCDHGDRHFYSEYLVAHGMANSIVTRLMPDSGRSAWLTCARPANGGAFTEVDKAWMVQIGYHLTHALDHFDEVARRDLQGRAARSARSVGASASLVLDGNLRLLDPGEDQLRSIAGTGAFMLDGQGRLRGRSRAADLSLGQGADRLRRGEIEVAHVESGAGNSKWLTLQSIQGQGMAIRRLNAGFWITIHDSPALHFDAGRIRALFGLTPAETRLAVAIAEGVPLREAAARASISVETARTYSKRIYAKTGLHGQSELIRGLISRGCFTFGSLPLADDFPPSA